MIWALFIYSTMPIQNLNKKSFISNKSNEHQVEIEQTENFKIQYQPNDNSKPSTMWIVISIIIGVVFVIIIIVSICSCCKHSKAQKVVNSGLSNQDNYSSSNYHFDQQIYQQNLQQQNFIQQQVLQQNILQQQRIMQQNMQ